MESRHVVETRARIRVWRHDAATRDRHIENLGGEHEAGGLAKVLIGIDLRAQRQHHGGNDGDDAHDHQADGKDGAAVEVAEARLRNPGSIGFHS